MVLPRKFRCFTVRPHAPAGSSDGRVDRREPGDVSVAALEGGHEMQSVTRLAPRAPVARRTSASSWEKGITVPLPSLANGASDEFVTGPPASAGHALLSGFHQLECVPEKVPIP